MILDQGIVNAGRAMADGSAVEWVQRIGLGDLFKAAETISQ